MTSATKASGRLAAALAGVLPTCTRSDAPPRFPEPIADVVAASEALGDPYGGRFPLDEALLGLPAGDALLATLATDEGDVHCTLDVDHAPLSVASFVGLSRGVRPFRGEDDAWHAGQPYYVDMPWHRAQAGQFVQTGRRGRLENGGFFLQDEIAYGDSFDRGGVLALANNGSEHGASVEFFVTTGPAPHLEGHHTIIGRCDDEAVVRRIEARVVRSDPVAPRLVRIDVTRR